MKPWIYFMDSWNVFDFVIVVCLLSVKKGSPAAQMLPLIRLLRVIKLVNAIPELQVLVSSLLKSLVSIGSVFVLLSILFYIYAVLAVFLFSENDPFHFENLQSATLTLYRVSTFEDWTDVMYINLYGCAGYGGGIYQTNSTSHAVMSPSCALPGMKAPSYMSCTPGKELNGVISAFFFCTFTLFASMIMFNLFIGVILGNMDKAKDEIKADMEKLGDILELSSEVDSKSYLERKKAVIDRFAAERWKKIGGAVSIGGWRRWKGMPGEPPSEELAFRLSQRLLDQLNEVNIKVQTLKQLHVLTKIHQSDLFSSVKESGTL